MQSLLFVDETDADADADIVAVDVDVAVDDDIVDIVVSIISPLLLVIPSPTSSSMRGIAATADIPRRNDIIATIIIIVTTTTAVGNRFLLVVRVV